MKRKMLLAIAFITLFEAIADPGIFCLSLDDLVGQIQADALFAGEKPVIAQFKNPNPQLIPRNQNLVNFVEEIKRNINPNVMVETLHIYRKPIMTESAAWSIEEESSIYNEILALSTLTGLQYYSESRGKIWTLYEISSIIDGPSTKRSLPDPVYTIPQANLTVYARQKDSSFGDNIYQYDFHSIQGAIIFKQQNLTSLSYGIIPAVRKNNLCSVVAIMDIDNYLLVYVALMANTASFPGMKERMKNSFANRADALFNWFSNRADIAFTKAHQR